MAPTEAFDTLQALNEQHQLSMARRDFCSCGWKTDECIYFLMLELMNTALIGHMTDKTPTRTITEYGYMYDGKPCWSPTSSVSGGWDYTEARTARQYAALWAVPECVGPMIEREVTCYETVPGEHREIRKS